MSKNNNRFLKLAPIHKKGKLEGYYVYFIKDELQTIARTSLFPTLEDAFRFTGWLQDARYEYDYLCDCMKKVIIHAYYKNPFLNIFTFGYCFKEKIHFWTAIMDDKNKTKIDGYNYYRSQKMSKEDAVHTVMAMTWSDFEGGDNANAKKNK